MEPAFERDDYSVYVCENETVFRATVCAVHGLSRGTKEGTVIDAEAPIRCCTQTLRGTR